VVGVSAHFEEVPPDPAATIESLRSLGYSLASAVADLVDNSIAARVEEQLVTVQIMLHWAGGQSWLAVVDDGRGMTEDELRQAMRIGSWDPQSDRGPHDLGRFGFGLKTASFSQCRELTVATKAAGSDPFLIRSWDLDHVRRTGKWELRASAPPGADDILGRLQPQSSGTVVLWRRLTSLVDPAARAEDEVGRRRLTEQMAGLEGHLGMTFGRFLTRSREGLALSVNSQPVQAWDPFLTAFSWTQPLPQETSRIRGHAMAIKPNVLPYPGKLTAQEQAQAAGPMGWNAQQGFYIYRQDRLIAVGTWLGLRALSSEDAYNLARISVDIPQPLDSEWSLNITKGTVQPPDALRQDLTRIAIQTRRRARAVLRSRGGMVGGRKNRAVIPVWQQRRRHGELVLSINRQHPIIVEALSDDHPSRRRLEAVLDLIEETIPSAALPSAQPHDRRASDGTPPQPVIELARRLYEKFLLDGLTRQQAADKLLSCEPFGEYPDLLESM
jgi:Histidine kinase-, DNA gyrase B-, and HSP90-like ATPase